MAIINSLLNIDYYKLTMLQAYYHQYPTAVGRWKFLCRNKDIKLGFLVDEVIEEVLQLSNLRLSIKERSFLESTGDFKEDFLNWFQDGMEFDFQNLSITNRNGELKITVEGKLIQVNLLEVYILSIVNELYFKDDFEKNNLYLSEVFKEGFKNLDRSIDLLKDYPDLKFAEFGTRRRYSHQWQDEVIRYLKQNCPNNLAGTSNVYFAMKHGLKPIGTCAHSWTCSHLGLVDDIKEAQKRALYVWKQEYGSKLGIALSDTFTSKAFFRDFDVNLSNLYDGTRHDSGDPVSYGYNVIQHYRDSGIDPKTKVIVFSDGLDIDKAIELYKEFNGKIGVNFGIGTSLTNSVGRNPLNIVMKLLECNGTPVVKLSDEPGKEIGDPQMLEKVKEAYKIKG
jgi:nicotinate phosphoribosyltransferase